VKGLGPQPPQPYRILSDEDVARIVALRQRYPGERSAVMPALWILQDKEGILTAAGMREVARALELPAAHVEAVASFYTMYFFKPHGRYLVEMCTSMSCLVCGAGKVMKRFEDRLGIRAGETTPDELVTLLEVECLGACGGAPAAQINHAFFENLTEAQADQLVSDMRGARLDVHRLQTGTLAAAAQPLVNLREPGANRVSLPANGAAGPVVDAVRGSAIPPRGSAPAGAPVPDEELPAQYRGRR
jgi:NADH-quinone oxidoreductase subunit E